MEASTKGRRRRPRTAIALAALVLVTGIGLLRIGVIGPYRLESVVPGRIFRSRQPETRDLERAVRERGIRSVICLRDNSSKAAWFAEERDELARLGIRFEGIHFSLKDPVSRDSVLALVESVGRLPEPILFHCRGGHDRSGFAAAIITLLQPGKTLDDAGAELSLLRGHSDFRASCPFHRFLEVYRSSLARRGIPHSPEVFRAWLPEEYAPADYDARLEVDGAPAESSPGKRIPITVLATNLGSTAWEMKPDGRRGVRFGVRRIGPLPDGASVPDNTASFQAAGPVDVGRAGPSGKAGPSERISAGIDLELPAAPGRYVFEFDLVDEGVRWFHDVGRPGAFREILVK